MIKLTKILTSFCNLGIIASKAKIGFKTFKIAMEAHSHP